MSRPSPLPAPVITAVRLLRPSVVMFMFSSIYDPIIRSVAQPESYSRDHDGHIFTRLRHTEIGAHPTRSPGASPRFALSQSGTGNPMARYPLELDLQYPWLAP